MLTYLSKPEITEDFASITDSLVQALAGSQKPLWMLPGGKEKPLLLLLYRRYTDAQRG